MKRWYEEKYENMEPFEKECMLKLWGLANEYAADVNSKKSFIYWDEVQAIINNLSKRDYFMSEGAKDYLLCELEQKVHIVQESEENNEFKFNRTLEDNEQQLLDTLIKMPGEEKKNMRAIVVASYIQQFGPLKFDVGELVRSLLAGE